MVNSAISQTTLTFLFTWIKPPLSFIETSLNLELSHGSRTAIAQVQHFSSLIAIFNVKRAMYSKTAVCAESAGTCELACFNISLMWSLIKFFFQSVYDIC
jgi:hypothetical protein